MITKKCVCLSGHSFGVLVDGGGGGADGKRNPEIEIKKSKSKSLLNLAAPSILYMTQRKWLFSYIYFFFLFQIWSKTNKVIGYFLFTILVWSMGQELYWHILRLGRFFFFNI